MRIQYNLPNIEFGSMYRIFKRFRPFLAQHRGKLLLAIAALFGATLLALLRPWPLKIVIDFVLLPNTNARSNWFLEPLTSLEPMTIIALAAGTVITLSILEGVCNYFHAVLTKTVGHMLVGDIRSELFSHVQRLPLSYHDYRETGDLLTRLTDDISLLEDLMVTTIIGMVTKAMLIASIFGVVFWLDWQLGLVVVGIVPIFMLAAFRFSVRLRSVAKRQREMYGKVVASMQESLAGISQIKSYGQEKTREKLISKSVGRDVKANIRSTRLSANYERMVDFIVAAGTAVVLWVGARKAFAGQISAGDLVLFLTYLRAVYSPIKGIARQTSRMAKATVRGEKILELLDMKPEVSDNDEGLSAREITGDIRFEHVDFSYKSDRPVLRDISFRLPAGKTTVILGSTGAGKSTIAKLILRLYNVRRGTIWLDDRNIDAYRVHSVRKAITSLAQETFLFRTSLAENIAFGKRKATTEDIIEAARIAGAEEFIGQLPDGLETLVGEGGATLSGGQRQRISFARAALRRSPVMIFDEPATGLDVHAERQAKEVFQRMRVGRTMIIITHRLHYLDMADWVVLVQDGQVVEEGEPATLFDRRQAYYQFVSAGAELIGKHLSKDATDEQGREITIPREL